MKPLFAGILILLFAVLTFAQVEITYPTDGGTEVALGKAVKISSDGTISLCDDNDPEVIGIVKQKFEVGSTIYYDITNSGLSLAPLAAGVSAGDLLTTSPTGNLRTANRGETVIGKALQDGDADPDLESVVVLIRTGRPLDFVITQYDSAQPGANAWIDGKLRINDSLIVSGITKLDSSLYLNYLPDDAAPDTVLTVVNGQVQKVSTGDLPGGADNDWSGAGTGQMYATDSDDSVAIGNTSAATKLDVDGGIMMRGDRYWGLDASEADSFWFFDDGDTFRVDADNPVKIGDGSLIVGTNGVVYASDSLYIGSVAEDSLTDSVLCLTNTGKVSWMDISNAGNAVIQSYGEMHIDDTTGVVLTLPANSAKTVMDSAQAGLVRGTPYVTAYTNAGDDSLVVLTEGAGVHQMNLSLTFTGGSGTELRMGLCINDTIQGRFVLGSDIASADEVKSSNLSGLMELNSGDIITVKLWNNRSQPGTEDITIYNFSVHLTRIYETSF